MSLDSSQAKREWCGELAEKTMKIYSVGLTSKVPALLYMYVANKRQRKDKPKNDSCEAGSPWRNLMREQAL